MYYIQAIEKLTVNTNKKKSIQPYNFERNLTHVTNNNLLSKIKNTLDKNVEKFILKDDILDSSNTLIDLKKANLENKKENLRKINNKLVTRDRLIDYTHKEIDNKAGKINIIRKVYVVIIILLVLFVLFSTKMLSLDVTYLLAFTTILVYILYIAWAFNTLDIHKSTSPEIEKIRAVVGYIGDQIYNEGNKLEREYQKYINENCKCPNKKNKQKNKDDKDDKDDKGKPVFSGNKVELNDGSYYYDGTAPKEKIDPPVTKKRYAINWETAPDYGVRNNKQYTPDPTWLNTDLPMPETISQPNPAKRIHIPYNHKNAIDFDGTWTDNL